MLSLRDSSPTLRNNNLAKFSLKLVFWDSKVDKYTSTELAHLNAKDLGSPTDRRSGGGGGTIDRTLSEAKYVVGDFLDIAYIVPGANPVGPGPASHVPTNGPQFAPLQAPSGPRGIGGGPQGARGVGLGGPRGGSLGLPATRGDTWANSRGGGFGGAGGRGGARFAGNGVGGGGRPVPADQGWGNRRSRMNTAEDKSGVTERVRFTSPDSSKQSDFVSLIPAILRVDSRRRVLDDLAVILARCLPLKVVDLDYLVPNPVHPIARHERRRTRIARCLRRQDAHRLLT